MLGNHDCAYCFDFGSASRYDYENEFEIKEMFKENMDLFKLCYLRDDVLFSHAGITNNWLNIYFPETSIESFVTLPMESIIPYLWEVSTLRGGWSETGSIVWSDVMEGDRESTFYQVFGHTQLESKPVVTDKWACLDVRQCFILDTESHKIEELEK